LCWQGQYRWPTPRLAPCLVGKYNGGQMELAAELDLTADGHFQYGLAYGALDEEAQGRWKATAAMSI
jgi:hypothetical protein